MPPLSSKKTPLFSSNNPNLLRTPGCGVSNLIAKARREERPGVYLITRLVCLIILSPAAPPTSIITLDSLGS